MTVKLIGPKPPSSRGRLREEAANPNIMGHKAAATKRFLLMPEEMNEWATSSTVSLIPRSDELRKT